MSGRHARTPIPLRPAATFTERVTRRPARVAFVLASGVAIAAPMVAAEPVAAPPSAEARAIDASVTEIRGAAADAVSTRLAAPGEGPVNTIGYATVLAAQQSSSRADATATFMSGSLIAVREAAAAEAARVAAERVDAERRQAERDAAARRAEAEAQAQAAAAPAVASGSAWDALAQCESGGNWGINTGNGYYGGLQFSLSSWQGVGGTGYPHEASRETQIAMGERLKGSGGWGHWPACSRKLGLR